MVAVVAVNVIAAVAVPDPAAVTVKPVVPHPLFDRPFCNTASAAKVKSGRTNVTASLASRGAFAVNA